MQQEANCNMVDSFRPEIDYQPKGGDVIAYTLSKKDFQEFLRKPSMDASSGFAVYRKSMDREGYIEVEIFNVNGNAKYEAVSGYLRIGSWPVYTEFIDFMDDVDNFKQILSKRGIYEEILSYVIIEHITYEAKENELIPPGTYPTMCIWIHTDAGDYFLEHKANGDILDTDFTYDFYDLIGYSKKYGFK